MDGVSRRAYQRKHYKKHVTTAEGRAYYAEKRRRQREKLLADPVRLAKARDTKKRCAAALYQRQYATVEDRKQRWAELRAKKYATPETWLIYVMSGARVRSRRRNVAFDLSREDVYVPARCPVFGVEFVYGVKGHPNSPSLDRIIPTLGYVKGNVAVISRRANMIKHNASAVELERVAAWLREVS